ncbi:MAG: hypothetical protein P4L46_08830 [Fimbriimonas sp.]|nr:hypothetical protein [Fimbriimonas sp.]
MLIPLIAFAIAVQKDSDAWNLNVVLDPKVKLSWGVTVDAQAEGQEHHATFQFSRQQKSSDDKKTVVTFVWDHMTVDEQEGQEIPAWDAVTGPRGEILKLDDGSDDSYRRMLSPIVFVYPEKPVSPGDKWSYVSKPDGAGVKINYDFEATKTELVDGVQTIILAMKYKEDGADGATGEGNWWLSRVGRVVKFEVKVKNWVVPIAGPGSVDATLKGKAL